MGLVPQGDLDAMAAAINDATANATLTTITGPGVPDRNGDPGEGEAIWSGEARGFLARERHETVSGGQQVPVRMDSFVILDGVAQLLEVAGPDWEATRVTIRDERTSVPVSAVFTVTGWSTTRTGCWTLCC
jgi:hypothetical protein